MLHSYSVLITILIFAGSLGFGTVLLRQNIPGIFVYRFGLGLWLMAHLVYLSGLVQLLNTTLIWSLLLAGVFLLFLQISTLREQVGDFLKHFKKINVHWLVLSGWVLVVFLAILTETGALTPEIQRDSLVYHLTLPKLYLAAGQWYEIPQNIYSYFPGFVESLYGLGLGLGMQYPALIHFGFGLGCLAATYELGRLLGLRREIRLLCVAGLFATPTFFLEMTWAYVDLANTFFWLLTAIAFIHWSEERNRQWLLLLGFSMGAAYGCKYTSLLLFLVIPLGILFELRRRKNISGKEALVSLAIPMLTGILLAAPWWLRNVMLTGNPFFPFLWNLFPTQSTQWDANRAGLYSMMLEGFGGSHKTLVDYLSAPIKVFINAKINNPDLYDGQLGFFYLLGLPVIFYVRKLPRQIFYLLGLVVFYMAYWAVSSQQARFLLVILPGLSLFAGYMLQLLLEQTREGSVSASVSGKSKLTYTIYMGMILLAVGFNLTNTLKIFHQEGYLDYVLGKVTKEQYLGQKLDYYGMYSFINERLPKDAHLFMVMTGNQGYYLERQYFSDAVFEAATMKKLLAETDTAAEVAQKMADRGWTHLLLRKDYFLMEFGLLILPEEEKRLQELFNKHLKKIKIAGQFWLYEIQ